MTTRMDTRPPVDDRPPPLHGLELARWAWRQLTSMRVALILLFLLAVAAIPGSVIPQSDVNPLNVRDFRARNPTLSEWYDRLGLFDVYSAPWFAAIYLALLVSLVGCILPRCWQHWKAVRAQPPKAPRRLSRLPAYRRIEVDAAPAEVLAVARAELRSRRFRLRRPGADGDDDAVAAEIGHLRETGNLLFHLSVVVVLLAVALGGLFSYRATVLVPEGSGFSNQVIQFDSLSAGALFDPADDLPPFSMDVESFTMEFVDAGNQIGQPSHYEATVSLVREPGAEPETHTIRVNEPLDIDGTSVHIINPGYAPAFTVRAADRETILAEGPVPFLPDDSSFTSTGVVKVEVPPELGDDIGIQANFLPTAYLDENGPRSVFPGARNPEVYLTAWHGDLGLDDGRPQSVYRLDTDDMEQYSADGEPFRSRLAVGDTVELPDGRFITFDGYVTWVNLQIGRNSGRELALVGAVLAVVGLMGSLYVRRRRAWVRASVGPEGRTVVEVAGLHRTEGAAGDRLADEIGAITDGLLLRLGGAKEKRED
ncbi:cytochrome c biogenesis protein ResB [Jiangella ureilytica]|uniref:Cytochrome c biogenesis protein ResB n=1 Tax=Jiangella ureilytica TaxID=2530374 RepID=A0A4R4RDZ7_9ACTN|nr:cytochrome c biogenesis protein ResB [Jiangella ureilytica]TDC47541.1 cytochrome c biogenesis protein ResB [Jiangella ureilytica]